MKRKEIRKKSICQRFVIALLFICILTFAHVDPSVQVRQDLEVLDPSLGIPPRDHVMVGVLIDTSHVTYYSNYQYGVKKWLDYWKMDYQEINVSDTAITRSLLTRYNVILIPQFNLTKNGHLSSAELQVINQTVHEEGVGLVHLDACISAYTSIWRDYNKLFHVTWQNWYQSTTIKMNLTIPTNNHFITQIYRNQTEMKVYTTGDYESDLAFANVTLNEKAQELAFMPYNNKNYSAIIVKNHGKGKTMISTFSTGRYALNGRVIDGFDGFGERPFRTKSGMHGLLWRSIVWTAKKPFAFIGMPPFQTFRVDDVGLGSLSEFQIYVNKFIEYGWFMNLYVFVDNIHRDADRQVILRNWYGNGSTHIAAHAWKSAGTNCCIYWNQDPNEEYDDATLAKFFNWLDGNFTDWNITSSAYMVAHFAAVGQNAAPYLSDRGWIYFANGMGKGLPPTSGERPDWLFYGYSYSGRGLSHIDWWNDAQTIFTVNFCIQRYSQSGDVFSGATNPTDKGLIISRMLDTMEHGLADLFWAAPYTHQTYCDDISASEYDTILSAVEGNLTALYPFRIKTSYEHIARYAYNQRFGPEILDYNYTGDIFTLNFTGTSTLPTAFYLFTDQKISSYTGILDYWQRYGHDGYLIWIPAYSGNHEVSITLSSSETNSPHIHYTTANITSTSSNPSSIVINAQQMWKHTDPKYSFEINCTHLGPPQLVTVDANPIFCSYDDVTKIARFNVTFQIPRDILVSWNTTENPVWDITGPTMWVPDGICDIRDIAIAAIRFGSVEGDGTYDARADITSSTYLIPDGIIDIRDISLIAQHFGEGY